MTLDEVLAHWRSERARLTDIDNWVDAGKPPLPLALQPSLECYARLKKPDAKKALKQKREELAKDAFMRMFSAFEVSLRATFSEWLRRKCGTTAASEAIDEQLPAIEGVLRLAAILEPRYSRSRAGHVGNVRDFRNSLAHGGFALPVPYDLEELHRELAEVIAVFSA